MREGGGGSAVLEEAATRIESWNAANGNKLPRPEVGTAELEGLTDQWGNALHYLLENSRAGRVTSNGPDGEAKTKWDVGLRIALKEEEEKKAASWTDRLHPERPWLDRRKEELGYKDVPIARLTELSTNLTQPNQLFAEVALRDGNRKNTENASQPA